MSLQKSLTDTGLHLDNDSDSGKSEFDEEYYANKPPSIPIDYKRVKTINCLNHIKNVRDQQHNFNTILNSQQQQQQQHSIIQNTLATTTQGQCDFNSTNINIVKNKNHSNVASTKKSSQNDSNTKNRSKIDLKNLENQLRQPTPPLSSIGRPAPTLPSIEPPKPSTKSTNKLETVVGIIDANNHRQNINKISNRRLDEENSQRIGESPDISSDNFQSPTTWSKCLSCFFDCICCCYNSSL